MYINALFGVIVKICIYSLNFDSVSPPNFVLNFFHNFYSLRITFTQFWYHYIWIEVISLFNRTRKAW